MRRTHTHIYIYRETSLRSNRHIPFASGRVRLPFWGFLSRGGKPSDRTHPVDLWYRPGGGGLDGRSGWRGGAGRGATDVSPAIRGERSRNRIMASCLNAAANCSPALRTAALNRGAFIWESDGGRMWKQEQQRGFVYRLAATDSGNRKEKR